jgi:hypothetical protein
MCCFFGCSPPVGAPGEDAVHPTSAPGDGIREVVLRGACRWVIQTENCLIQVEGSAPSTSLLQRFGGDRRYRSVAEAQWRQLPSLALKVPTNGKIVSVEKILWEGTRRARVRGSYWGGPLEAASAEFICEQGLVGGWKCLPASLVVS